MGGCCVPQKKYIGNVIFKPIVLTIEKCGIPELDVIFDQIAAVFLKAEEVRVKVADKFKNMIIHTGACVLKQPTIERSISSFILQIFIEVNKTLEGDYEKLKAFNYSALFDFNLTPPFFSFNPKTLETLKKSLSINLDDHKDLMQSKQAIFEFIESLILLKDWFLDIKNQILNLYNQCGLFLLKIKDKLKSSGEDHITLMQAKEYIVIGERNLESISNISQLISVANSFFIETASAVSSLADKILRPKEILNLQKIAAEAYTKKIYDPKEIVYFYSKYEKCRKVADWQENIGYKLDGTETLEF